MSSAPDHIYLDLSIVNNDKQGSKIKSNLQFNENRTNPILDNPFNYEMAVVRFQVDTPGVTLPLFIPLLDVDGTNADINQTAYTITMAQIASGGTALTNLKTANIKWNPEDKSVPLPSNSFTNGYLTSQDIATGYYNCYNVKWWLSCVNATLDNVWKQFAGNTSAFSPTMVVDDGSNLITLLTPFIQSGSGVTNFNFAVSESKATGSGQPIYLSTGSNPAVQYVLFFNEPLFNLFSGFPSVYYGDTLASKSIFDNAPDNATVRASPFLLNYFIQPINYDNANIITIPNPVAGKTANFWVTTTSEYSPVPMWNPIMALQFSSTLLPKLLSYTSASIPFNDLNASGLISSGNNSQVTDMITDIQVGLNTGSEYKPSILFLSKAQYRLIDLLGNQPVYNVDFKVSWKSKYGQVIPLKLGSQCGANLKLLFRRKRFDLLNLPPYNTN